MIGHVKIRGSKDIWLFAARSGVLVAFTIPICFLHYLELLISKQYGAVQ
jgi:hypothetical protein